MNTNDIPLETSEDDARPYVPFASAAAPVKRTEMTLSYKPWHEVLSIAPMPVLYTDTINGEQIRRDDVWLATTEQLASSAPLVAVTDKPMDAENWAELYRLREAIKGPNGFATWQEAAEHERLARINLQRDLDSTILGHASQKPFGYIDLSAVDNPRLEKRWNTREFMGQTTPFYLASQVSPQATVEPLTDERASFTKWAQEAKVAYRDDQGFLRFYDPLAGSHQFIGWEARALLAATPTASKATEELASMTRMFQAACSDIGLINEALGLDPDDGGADPILEAIELLQATSKADTGEMLNKLVFAYFENNVGENVFNLMTKARAVLLAAATPSTIKADHINDAVEMVAPTGEQL
jgi:hypothetical protein